MGLGSVFWDLGVGVSGFGFRVLGFGIWGFRVLGVRVLGFLGLGLLGLGVSRFLGLRVFGFERPQTHSHTHAKTERLMCSRRACRATLPRYIAWSFVARVRVPHA